MTRITKKQFLIFIHVVLYYLLIFVIVIIFVYEAIISLFLCWNLCRIMLTRRMRGFGRATKRRRSLRRPHRCSRGQSRHGGRQSRHDIVLVNVAAVRSVIAGFTGPDDRPPSIWRYGILEKTPRRIENENEFHKYAPVWSGHLCETAVAPNTSLKNSIKKRLLTHADTSRLGNLNSDFNLMDDRKRRKVRLTQTR